LKTGKGSVSSFKGPDGKRYFPGDTVDLPVEYKGVKWLEPLEAPNKVEPAAAPATPAPATEEKPASPSSKTGKKSRS